ncbi:replication initiation protein [Shewanella bicestrii]
MNKLATSSVDAQRFFLPSSALNRVLTEAPYRPRCSADKTASISQPVSLAIRYPYMQVNRRGMVSWLVFDLDHANPLCFEKVGLPAPNLIVINRDNNHSHLFYAITPVCTTDNARAKPISYMKAVYDAMARALDADPAYSGPVAKTPGHPWWKTWEIHNQVYSLDELADYIDLPQRSPWSTGPNLDAVSNSRHCMLFEETRFYAYSIVNKQRESGSFKHFKALVASFAHNRNNYSQRGFSSNLTSSQVAATVKSISRWTWDKYRGNSRCHKGVMALYAATGLTSEAKQKLSAARTHQVRKRNTESKIRAAANQILAKGIEPSQITQVMLAAHSGLTRQTIAKYPHILTEVVATHATSKKVVKMPKRSHTNNVLNVNYGEHQITPGFCKKDSFNLGGDVLNDHDVLADPGGGDSS